MCVRGIDQDAASPINAQESIGYSDPVRGKNDDVALGCLLLRAGAGAWTEISDKISQCLRTSGIGYNDGVTSVDQVTTESTRYFTSTYKSYFHDESPFSVGIANEFAFQLIAAISRASPDSGVRPEMDVQDGLAGLRIFRSAPPARDSSHSSSLVDNASRRGHPLHDGVEGDASGRSLQAPFVGFSDNPHGRHRSFIFRTYPMGDRPGAVLLNCRVHGYFSRAARLQRVAHCIY
jgi:hypothetical protein